MSFASVCVLSYERPQFLRACLETVRDAGLPIEILVHDDGSEDPAVMEFLTEMLSRGQISSLLANPPGCNQGVGLAAKKLFAAAQGDVLIKCDQDLCMVQDWLVGLRRILEDKRVGAAGLFSYHHDPVDVEKTRILGLEPPDGSEHFYVTDFVGSAVAMTRETYRTFGPWPVGSAAFAEDIELKQKIAQSGLFMALPEKDLAVNVGFGVGPSTVVVAEGTVRRIAYEPVVFDGLWR